MGPCMEPSTISTGQQAHCVIQVAMLNQRFAMSLRANVGFQPRIGAAALFFILWVLPLNRIEQDLKIDLLWISFGYHLDISWDIIWTSCEHLLDII